MTVAQMRAAIHDAYPGQKWKRQVLDMPDDQVIAVYRRLEAKGRFSKKKVIRKEINTNNPYGGIQISIDDI